MSIQWPSIAEVGMAAAMDGFEEEDMLDLMSMKNTLKQVMVFSTGAADEVERVKIPLSQSLRMEDDFRPGFGYLCRRWQSRTHRRLSAIPADLDEMIT